VRRVLVHGHRGARAVLPENTLAAFEYAIGVGADAIEMDVAVTRDDVPVISHDPRLPYGERIRDLSISDVRRLVPDIPTLEEVLELRRCGAFLFNIELKSFPRRPRCSPHPERFAGLAAQAVLRAGVEGRTLIQSFDFRVLHALEAIAPEIPRAALFELLRGRNFATIARRAGVRTVSPWFRLVTAKRVAAANAAGVEVITWTANKPRQWRRLIAAGVRGIITDDPAGLIAYLESGE
jgi:glycerophosphoryl diester phosphodiesterase